MHFPQYLKQKVSEKTSISTRKIDNSLRTEETHFPETNILRQSFYKSHLKVRLTFRLLTDENGYSRYRLQKYRKFIKIVQKKHPTR